MALSALEAAFKIMVPPDTCNWVGIVRSLTLTAAVLRTPEAP